jgi:hypothetical protein
MTAELVRTRPDLQVGTRGQFVLLNGEQRKFLELRELNGAVTPEYVRRNTRFEVVTGDLLDQSKRVVAHTYWEALEPDCSPEQVYGMLLEDGNVDNSLTVSAILNLPRSAEELEPSGNQLVVCSMRFVRGGRRTEDDLFPIKEMYEVVSPWGEILAGKSPEHVATVGRYAVISPVATHEHLRKDGIPGWLTGELLRLGKSETEAISGDIDRYFAVMSVPVVRHVERGGVGTTKLPTELWRDPQNYYEPRFNRVATQARAMYEMFPKYWVNGRPSLYEFHFDNTKGVNGGVPARRRLNP